MGVHDTRLFIAIQKHDMVNVEYEILNLKNVNYQCNSRSTALHSAVLYNNVEAARLLLGRGADMMQLPIKHTRQHEYECPLLLAFRMGVSREAVQLLFLSVLGDTAPQLLNAAALKQIAQLTQCAMMHCTPRVFFAASEYDGGKKRVNYAGLTPLFFTLRQVSLYENNVPRCMQTMQNVLAIVDRYPHIAWERYCSSDAKHVSTGTPGWPSVGSTALGMLMYETMPCRKQRDKQYGVMLDRKTLALAQVNVNTFGNLSLLSAEVDEKREQDPYVTSNRQVDTYFNKEFVPSLFDMMLSTMRIALGMATHPRLGERPDCTISQLGSDVMKMIFSQLLCDMRVSHVGFSHMLAGTASELSE